MSDVQMTLFQEVEELEERLRRAMVEDARWDEQYNAFGPIASQWRVELFGMSNLIVRPYEHEVPNAFWRFMQRICFGNKWVKDDIVG